MPRNIYFSAGEFCSTAHQIRRYTQNHEAYFFDWLITQDTSFDFLGRPNDEFLRPMNWEIIDNGIRLLDRYSGLAFQHEFKTIAGQPGVIDTNLIEEHLATAHQKFSHLKEKLITALKNTQRGVIIRADDKIECLDQAKTRLEQLKATFLPINPYLRFVVASTRLYYGEEFSPNYLLGRLNNPTPSNSHDAWKGDDQSWNRLFELAEKILVFDAPNFKD